MEILILKLLKFMTGSSLKFLIFKILDIRKLITIAKQVIKRT